MPVMMPVLAVGVSAYCWMIVQMMGGSFLPEVFGGFYQRVPDLWMRGLALALPIATGNLLIAILWRLEPVWAAVSFSFVGALMPVLIKCVMAKSWPSLEVCGLLALMGVCSCRVALLLK